MAMGVVRKGVRTQEREQVESMHVKERELDRAEEDTEREVEISQEKCVCEK